MHDAFDLEEIREGDSVIRSLQFDRRGGNMRRAASGTFGAGTQSSWSPLIERSASVSALEWGSEGLIGSPAGFGVSYGGDASVRVGGSGMNAEERKGVKRAEVGVVSAQERVQGREGGVQGREKGPGPQPAFLPMVPW